jgi:hypothetical protein
LARKSAAENIEVWEFFWNNSPCVSEVLVRREVREVDLDGVFVDFGEADTLTPQSACWLRFHPSFSLAFTTLFFMFIFFCRK